MVGMHTILCNTTIQVMGTITWQNAVNLLLTGKAVSIKDSTKVVRSPSTSIVVPEIAMLTEYVDESHLYTATDEFSRTMILRRDRYVCAYCGQRGTTVDHIVPRSRGGSNKWDNLITACRTCNAAKDDKLLVELGWELGYEPVPISKSAIFASYQDSIVAALEATV